MRPNQSIKPTAPCRNKLTHSLPLSRPSVCPSISHGLIRLQPKSLTLSGLPIHVARVPAAPFTRSYPRRFTLITRNSQCLRQLPSCVAVYPSDSQSRRVLCRLAPPLHSRLRAHALPPYCCSTLAVAYDVFFPRKHPSGFPSMSQRLIRLQPESLTLSGLPIHVARIPATPFHPGSILFDS